MRLSFESSARSASSIFRLVVDKLDEKLSEYEPHASAYFYMLVGRVCKGTAALKSCAVFPADATKERSMRFYFRPGRAYMLSVLHEFVVHLSLSTINHSVGLLHD